MKIKNTGSNKGQKRKTERVSMIYNKLQSSEFALHVNFAQGILTSLLLNFCVSFTNKLQVKRLVVGGYTQDTGF